MPSYNYSRQIGGDGIHISPDTYCIGHVGESGTLASRVKSDLGYSPIVRCNNTNIEIVFNETLTPSEKTILDDSVSAHKIVYDWPPA